MTTRVEGVAVFSDGSVRAGGSRRAWEDFIRTAGPRWLSVAYLAALEAAPGKRGEDLRAAYKLHGKVGVRRFLGAQCS